MDPYYEIVGMKRDTKGRWRYVARPIPQPEIEFECDDQMMETMVWEKAHFDKATRMGFEKQNNGKWLLKRIGD